ncbi:MAG: C45 family peptidase [Tetrasphaera sp.]
MTTLTQHSPPTDVTDWRAWLAYGLSFAAPTAAVNLAGPAARSTHAAPSAPRRAGQPALTLTMHAYREERPGARWQALARQTWPAYRRWFDAEGRTTRPSYAACRDALAAHLPELLSTWERLTALAASATGASTDETGRLLSLWCPTPFVTGCSQAILPGTDPVLVRSYDYDPALFEGVVASTDYSGRRRVLGTSDCLWGLLDGMNDAGLAVSLTYGGRAGRGPGRTGEGFGIPIVLRYLLETCATVPEAIALLRRVPIAQCYNISLVDTAGGHATVFVAPGEPALVSSDQVATNQRLDTVEDSHLAALLRSPLRHDRLTRLLADRPDREHLVAAFVAPPLHTTDYARGFGSLYAAAYRPATGSVEYHWPGRTWTRRFDDPDEVITVEVPDEPAEPAAHRPGQPRPCRSRGGDPRPGGNRIRGGLLGPARPERHHRGSAW